MDRLSKPVRYLIAFILLFLFGVIISHFSKSNTVLSKHTLTLPTEIKHIIDPQKTQSMTVTVQTGDTLASILQTAKLPATLSLTLAKLPNAASYLNQLHVGNQITITKTLTDQLQTLTYVISPSATLHIDTVRGQLVARITKTPLTETTLFKTGVIHHSLDQAAMKAGFTSGMLTQLNNIFAHSNIAHELHEGAHLYVLYHEYFLNDQKDHPGDIIAAEIVDHKKRYSMVRFKTPNNPAGYYNEKGHGTASLFLQKPLHYDRVSSHFSYGRMDPVLHKIHPHLGVDFAAPLGTPVRAIGDGTVLFCKKYGGYGNAVMIRYNSIYKTLYGHLRKFAAHLHANEHVKKGQIVGYVGSTGWSTGPHLHFEVYKNGKPINPLTWKYPHTPPIPAKYLHNFAVERDQRLTELNLFIDALKAKHS